MMDDPSVLVADIVTALRGNGALVALLGNSAANIGGYVDSFPSSNSLYDAVLKMEPPEALVAWRGTTTNRQRNSDAIAHDFSVALRPMGPSAPVWVALREGVTTVSGQKFKLTQIHDSVLPPQNMNCAIRQLVFGESVALEYLEVTFSLIERGLDN